MEAPGSSYLSSGDLYFWYTRIWLRNTGLKIMAQTYGNIVYLELYSFSLELLFVLILNFNFLKIQYLQKQ